MKKKLYLPYAEFYITNVCNLTCEGCNRFNRFNFKGWQAWQDWKHIYEQWGEELDIGTIAIMGGEPLLNPDLYQWIEGIGKIWPAVQIEIVTNGTRLHVHDNLYQVLLHNPYVRLTISVHNKMHKKDLIKKTQNFLKGPFEYQADTTLYRESLSITDSNRISVKIEYNRWCHQGAIITDADSGRFLLHNSDPVKAHEICHSKTCHHFDHGRLYKCGPAALFPEFDKQHKLDLTEQDRELMVSVPSVGIDDTMQDKAVFLQHINDPIPQCKFCPEVYHGKQIFAIEKKKC